MKTLVLNCGSSSLKFQLIDPQTEELLAKGLVEKIGSANAIITYKNKNNKELREVLEVKNHEKALKISLKTLTDKGLGVLSSTSEIEAVGHRVVHGGEKFSGSILITPEVIDRIKECSIFAPLHNPPNLMGIEACSAIMKDVDQVAVFDTDFHQQIPAYAYTYGLPYAIYEKLKIRRYGFHGTSHWYVSQKAAELLKRDYKDFKVITCHLGNGASIAAVKNGVSIDTSMGFTPLEGLVMGTRCGDIDPAIVPYVMQMEKLCPKEIDNLMNKSSGLKGISKTSNDVREVIEEADNGSPLHKLALDGYCYRIKKYIASYLGVLNGTDAIVFTAGVGENSARIRGMVCDGLDNLGIVIDSEKNSKNETTISKGKTNVMVVPTNEELAIARETFSVLNAKMQKKIADEKANQIREQLSSLTDAEKAAIAIFCDKNFAKAGKALYDAAKKELDLNIAQPVFEELLEAMEIKKDR